MIKITSINRKITASKTDNETELLVDMKIMDTNCNVMIAVDRNYNKAHFELNSAESDAFEEFCQEVEQRIAGEIADSDIGLASILPLQKADEEKAKAASV